MRGWLERFEELLLRGRQQTRRRPPSVDPRPEVVVRFQPDKRRDRRGRVRLSWIASWATIVSLALLSLALSVALVHEVFWKETGPPSPSIFAVKKFVSGDPTGAGEEDPAGWTPRSADEGDELAIDLPAEPLVEPSTRLAPVASSTTSAPDPPPVTDPSAAPDDETPAPVLAVDGDASVAVTSQGLAVGADLTASALAQLGIAGGVDISIGDPGSQGSQGTGGASLETSVSLGLG